MDDLNFLRGVSGHCIDECTFCNKAMNKYLISCFGKKRQEKQETIEERRGKERAVPGGTFKGCICHTADDGKAPGNR